MTFDPKHGPIRRNSASCVFCGKSALYNGLCADCAWERKCAQPPPRTRPRTPHPKDKP